MQESIFDPNSIRYLMLVIESANWEKLHLRFINDHRWDLLDAWKVNQ